MLNRHLSNSDACLVIDIDLPEMNDVELRSAAAASGCLLPVIFYITAHVDAETRRLAVDACPVALLPKLFRRDESLGAIESALQAGTHS